VTTELPEGYVDDIAFFDTILPSTGLRCVAYLLPSRKWAHIWGPDNAWLVQASQYIDTTRNTDVYYGCSSFAPQAQDKDPAVGGRKQANVALVRSFWVDLDVGPPEDGKPPKYATQKLAAEAICRFAIKHGMPLPGLANSGWGAHAYWPMDADMTVDQWKPVAEALKRALRADGVLFDPSRTADEASVLRPPGTHNHKHGQSKLVKVVREPTPWTLTGMMTALLPWAQPAAAPSIATAKLSAENAALGGGMGPDPSSAYMIADQCAVIGMMRDTGGKVDQPTWYYSLGVLLHTDEAPAICHEWSKGDARYTKAETDGNLARLATHGATTCAKLSEFQPAACAACPHFGQIKSPVQLGRPRAQKATVETVEQVVDKKGFATEVKATHTLPWGYGIEHRSGRRALTFTFPASEDKPAKTEVVCDSFLVATTRLWFEGVAHTEWEMDTREGPRRFITPNGTISKGGAEVAAALGSNEIYARPGKERLLSSYLTNWMQQLKDNADKVVAHKSFGWVEDVFVLGDTSIRPDGTEVRSIMRGIAEGKQDAVSRRGSLATWVKLVDRAYNAPGQEAFQFQMGCAFGAPLLSLMQQVNGVTVYSHSDGSGVGKSTVQQVGLSAWGDWRAMMLAQNKATASMLWGYLGAYNSLPIVYDELTNIPIAEVSDLVFSVSSGRAKERMTPTGEARSNNSNWSTILLASGNTLLSEKLAQHRANSEAEISRLFEFTLTATPHLSVVEANALFPQFLENYGHAGHKFARAVAQNREKIADALVKMQAKLVAEFQMTQVERHWSALFACVIVALLICRDLKLLAFEVEPIKAWMQDRLAENRGQRSEAVTDYRDLISQMIDELWADVLVTQGVGDLRANPPVPVNIIKHPRTGSLVGRAVRPTTLDNADLLISRNAIQKWCAKRLASPKQMREAGIAAGVVHRDIKRHCLGRGTRDYQTSDNVFCWRFFPDVLADSMSTNVAQHLSLVGSGKP
jgi:hypothetical protein